jgi:hypothetical protein
MAVQPGSATIKVTALTAAAAARRKDVRCERCKHQRLRAERPVRLPSLIQLPVFKPCHLAGPLAVSVVRRFSPPSSRTI